MELRAISVVEASSIVFECAEPLPPHATPLNDAAGKVLANDVTSTENVPPFDNSAMDGFAVMAADTVKASSAEPVTLTVTGKLHAGDWPDRSLSRDQTFQIMTGAPLPPGADAVVPIEHAELSGSQVKIHKPAASGDHCRSAGDDIKAGETVFTAGRVLDAYDVGVLASIGRTEVSTVRTPSIAIVSTGDELTAPGEPLRQGKIRASSTYAMAAQFRSIGCSVVDFGLIPDDPDKIRSALRQAFEHDIVLTTGGVSMGEHDFVRKALTDVGVDIRFWKVRQKPGKPLVFGVSHGRLFFGLPGNPVSTMICCKVYVEPAVRRMAGHASFEPTSVRAVLAEDIRKKSDLTQFVRGRVSLDNGKLRVDVSAKQSSGVLSSLAESNGLIVTPEADERLIRGTEVQVILLRPLESIVNEAGL